MHCIRYQIYLFIYHIQISIKTKILFFFNLNSQICPGQISVLVLNLAPPSAPSAPVIKFTREYNKYALIYSKCFLVPYLGTVLTFICSQTVQGKHRQCKARAGVVVWRQRGKCDDEWCLQNVDEWWCWWWWWCLK